MDVNRSEVECTVEVTGRRSQVAGPAICDLPPATSPAVRLGLGYIKGVAEEEASALVAERRRGGEYRDLADLASRSGMGSDGLQRLAWAGACESLGIEGGKAPRRD